MSQLHLQKKGLLAEIYHLYASVPLLMYFFLISSQKNSNEIPPIQTKITITKLDIHIRILSKLYKKLIFYNSLVSDLAVRISTNRADYYIDKHHCSAAQLHEKSFEVASQIFIEMTLFHENKIKFSLTQAP